jgi:hypothetical protein
VIDGFCHSQDWIDSVRVLDIVVDIDPPDLMVRVTMVLFYVLIRRLVNGLLLWMSLHLNLMIFWQNLVYLIIPQNRQNNEDPKWWYGLEKFSRTTLVENNCKELYLVAGGYGNKRTINTPNPNSFSINVPDRV